MTKPALTPILAAISTLPVIVACALLGAPGVRAATCTISPSTCDPYVVTIDQVGPNVVATSNEGGEFDLDGLQATSQFSLSAGGVINPGTLSPPVFPETTSTPLLGTGSQFQLQRLFFQDFRDQPAGPINFGPGGHTFASSSSGPPVNFNAISPFATATGQTMNLSLPFGYGSGDPLATSQATWDDATFATLGITPGDYVWRWGPAADQTFTIDAVPLPAALPLFASGLGALGLLGWRRKHKSRQE